MATTRKTISTNIVRELWAQCGGYCQNPACNEWLFAAVDETKVSLANVAHIIGHGKDGPRSDHELAEVIERDGISNLIMLCLVCHKIVDELEKKFSVETMLGWKNNHAKKISGLFRIPDIKEESVILEEVNELLDINKVCFQECGPFSNNVLNGMAGDGLLLWQKRSLDTILPNNQRIIQLVRKNRNNFPRHWDVYSEMLKFEVHVDAFQDNCLSSKKINDYKIFPSEFPNFVKGKLGIQSEATAEKRYDKLDFRFRQARTIIEQFLSTHSHITMLQQINMAAMLVELQDGRSLKVLVTACYFFTDHTFYKVLEIDPSVEAIINSHPAGSYTDSAKKLCIDNNVGLFTLGEFMGAVRKQGDEYLNYLLRSESGYRLETIKQNILKSSLPLGSKVYAFGSYLRRKIYKDIDLIFTYPDHLDKTKVDKAASSLRSVFEEENEILDLTVASHKEFTSMKFENNNVRLIYP